MADIWGDGGRAFMFVKYGLAVSFCLLVFLSGWVGNNVYTYSQTNQLQFPVALKTFFVQKSPELESPHDHVPEDKIHVYRDRIIVDLTGASWSTFADTNSMDPVLDTGANGIEIKPKSSTEIKSGDIISYKAQFTDGIVVHRVISTGFDGGGWYAIAKGDNNPTSDPFKVRFNDITGVVVGIIY